MQDRAATARIGDRVIAATTHAHVVEGNHYFPEEDVDLSVCSPSVVTTVCFWKGIARYRHITIDGARIRNAAWTYPLPSPLAWPIRRMIAFDPGAGVTITPGADSDERR